MSSEYCKYPVYEIKKFVCIKKLTKGLDHIYQAGSIIFAERKQGMF